MYLPTHFAQTGVPALHDLIRAHPLACVIVMTSAGFEANHIPLHLSIEGDRASLCGHVARANGMWRDHLPEHGALAVFQGPAHYVTPSWYPSKQVDGKVVPTWNYCVVHVRGRLIVHDDAGWVGHQIRALTNEREGMRAQPWAVDDAPADYTQRLAQAIVGIEIPIESIQGKWKVSQNQPEGNRQGVLDGLAAEPGDAARDMAQRVSGK